MDGKLKNANVVLAKTRFLIYADLRSLFKNWDQAFDKFKASSF